MAWRDYAIEVVVDYSEPGVPPGVDEDAAIVIDASPLEVAVEDASVVIGIDDPEAVIVAEETLLVDTGPIEINRMVG